MAKIELYRLSVLQKDRLSLGKAATERNGLFNQCDMRTNTYLIPVSVSLELGLLVFTVTPEK